MSAKPSRSARRSGAYFIKAGETRSQGVEAKSNGNARSKPSGADRQLVEALLKTRSG